jgi:hypothetical protein
MLNLFFFLFKIVNVTSIGHTKLYFKPPIILELQQMKYTTLPNTEIK